MTHGAGAAAFPEAAFDLAGGVGGCGGEIQGDAVNGFGGEYDEFSLGEGLRGLVDAGGSGRMWPRQGVGSWRKWEERAWRVPARGVGQDSSMGGGRRPVTGWQGVVGGLSQGVKYGRY